MNFEDYSRSALHIYSLNVPEMLARCVAPLGSGFVLVDVGCGDGNLVYSLKQAGLLRKASRVVGVDLSPIRVERFKENTGYEGIVASGGNVPMVADGTVDLLISTMVIEHVSDDAAYLARMKSMLSPLGRVYLSTVLKLPGAWYFRKTSDGRRALDVTHVREYGSWEEIGDVVEKSGLAVQSYRISPLTVHVAHPVLRVLGRLFGAVSVNRFFVDHPYLDPLQKLEVPVPRYRRVEAVLSLQR